MRALVTGASGFVGPHLVDHLLTYGDEVTAVDRRGEQPVDVTDADAVEALMQACAPDAVYHLAALSHVGDSWSSGGDAFRVNAEGTLHVLEAARRAGVQRVLVVGSAEEYGAARADDIPLSEESPLRPMTPYGVAKVAADFLALQAHLAHGLGTIRARPFNHTGRGQSDRFVIPALARRVAEAERDGASEVRVGSLDPVRDVTDVRDVVRAYRLLVEHAVPGEAYNVCSGRGVAVAEIAARLIALAERPLELVVDPALVRRVDVPQLVGDPSKLQAATGWTPLFDLDLTLADVLDEARAAVAQHV
ncbi:MAG: GDP-mannose 4,6-dehydratase [Actinobacteria bacterium]|nr:GDP-mannose 4,6-dehydratase [Actinomycetota bacterium]